MTQAIEQISDIIRAAIKADERDKTPREILGKIQPVIALNPSTNPICQEQCGPVPFALGGDVLVPDNKGGFTTKTQKLVSKGIDSSLSAGDLVLYTVTSGKKLYLVYLKLWEGIVGPGAFNIRDGGVGGTIKLTAMNNGTSNTEINVLPPSPVPVEFATDVTFESAGTTETLRGSLIGWEE